MTGARTRTLRVVRAICGSALSLLGPVQALKALEDSAEPRLVADALGVLEILDVEHPIAQLLHEAVLAQHTTHGSGTTQMLALIGFLCAEAEDLERAGLSPSVIVHGFAEAAELCLATADDLAVDIDQLLLHTGATRDRRRCELSNEPSNAPLQLFSSHQSQPKQLSAELEISDDEVDWFFADDDLAAATAPDKSPMLSASLSMKSLGGLTFTSESDSSILATAAATAVDLDTTGTRTAGNRYNSREPESLLADDSSSVSIHSHGGTIKSCTKHGRETCQCTAWRYIGPAACDLMGSTCSVCQKAPRSGGAAGSAWHLYPWRSLRHAAAGLHHGQPDMMDLALATALLLAVDSKAVSDSSRRARGAGRKGASALPWQGLTQISVMRMLGGADMPGEDCANVATTMSQGSSGHCVVAGLVLNAASADSPGQLNNIRVAMRVQHSSRESINITGTTPGGAGDCEDQSRPVRQQNVVDAISCATVDGAIPGPGDELSRTQTCEILAGCQDGEGLGLLAASGPVDPQVAHWCAAQGVVVLANMPRHSFHRLVSLCGSRAVHSFRSIKPTHISQQLLRLELWEQRGWYCGTGPPCPEDTAAANNTFQVQKSDTLVVSIAQKRNFLTAQAKRNTSYSDGSIDSRTVYARGIKPHVTVVLCASTDAAATLCEAGFWKCLGRLQSTLSTGKVLPGAGCFELYSVEALRRAKLEQEQQYQRQYRQQSSTETDTTNNAVSNSEGLDAHCADALQRCLAYDGFQRALEQMIRQALHNYLAPTYAEVCERLELASSVVQSRMRAKGGGVTLPVQWRQWQSSCPLLRQYRMHTAATTESTEHVSTSVDHSDCTENAATTGESESELVLDDLQAKRGAVSRASEFLRVSLLTDVVDLQALC